MDEVPFTGQGTRGTEVLSSGVGRGLDSLLWEVGRVGSLDRSGEEVDDGEVTGFE